MTVRPSSGVPSAWLPDWLKSTAHTDRPYGYTHRRELARPADLEAQLATMIAHAKCSPERLARLLERVKWLGASSRLAPPKTKQMRHGDFGEVLAVGVIETFVGHSVPVIKLRYQMDRDQSLHGTDIVAFLFDHGDSAELLSLEFVEVKVRASTRANAKSAVVDAHAQLVNDRRGKFTDTLEFLAERLEELSPGLSDAFDRYLASRDDEPEGMHRIVLVIDEDHFQEAILDDLPVEDELCLPLDIDIIHVKNLEGLIATVWPLVGDQALAESAHESKS